MARVNTSSRPAVPASVDAGLSKISPSPWDEGMCALRLEGRTVLIDFTDFAPTAFADFAVLLHNGQVAIGKVRGDMHGIYDHDVRFALFGYFSDPASPGIVSSPGVRVLGRVIGMIPASGSSTPAAIAADVAPCRDQAALRASERELISLGERLEAAWAAETAAHNIDDDDECERAVDAASALVSPIVARILALKASSPPALRVKARAFMWTQGGNLETPHELRGDRSGEDRTLVSLLDDILAMGGQVAAPS